MLYFVYPHACMFGRLCTSKESRTLQAEINIRKGRKFPVFELGFKAEWEVINGEEAKATGKVEVTELFQDDVDEDFEVSSLEKLHKAHQLVL